MKKLMLVGAALVLAACAESSTDPAASRRAPTRRSNDEITCRSGYVIAYDENGNPYCAPADGFAGDSLSRRSIPATQGPPRRQP